MIPLTPGQFLRQNREMFEAILFQINEQQRANRVAIERVSGQPFHARAYRFDDLLQSVERNGPTVLMAPLEELERQRHRLMTYFGVFYTDDAPDPDYVDPPQVLGVATRLDEGVQNAT